VITTSGVRSFLTSEGTRWFFGHYADMIQSPLLVWLLLLSLAYGAVRRSFFSSSGQLVKSTLGLRLSLLFLLAYFAAILFLILSPQAILLSATGSLWPSPFSHALVPLVSLGAIVVSAVYGFAARSFRYVADVVDSLVFGLKQCSPLLLLYILIIQLYESIIYVFF
jgi:aminobenzoyl-glutamate transport protein